MTQIAWTAEHVKAKLRGRHAATQSMGCRTVPGPWTCVEELLGCDLIAFAAVQRPANGHPGGAKYPRVGYEVKVSRSDYRKELRHPHKRAAAVAITHAFYFAVPRGLLTPQETGLRAGLAGDEQRTLWVPPDVGLVIVDRRGCRVVVESPVRPEPEPVDGALLGIVARHVSSHPDPRHAGVVETDRALCADLRQRERERNGRDLEARRRWNAEMAELRLGENGAHAA